MPRPAILAMSGTRPVPLLVAAAIGGYAIAAAVIWALAMCDPAFGDVLFRVGGLLAAGLLWCFVGATFTLAQLATVWMRPREDPGSGRRCTRLVPRPVSA